MTPFVHGPENAAERPPRTHYIDWHSLYPSEIILHGPQQQRRVSLTFDDGPDGVWTPRILQILAQYGVTATFCCVGQRVEQNPQVLRRIVRQGHMIANHSYNHPNFTKIPLEEACRQVNSTSNIIQRVAGVRPRFFRPPYGALNRDVIEMLISLDYKILYWDVDSLDWAGLTAAQVSINVLSHTEPGSIILMHSAGGVGESLADTAQALPDIIRTLRAQGYTFVKVSELLDEPAYFSSALL
ncbi:MAG: polysaccharide deacetylase family protein [Alicyclobacillus sp.]|nr:polysaccharide deacetylase family protein [Alicyclobacillus sp.]